MGYSCIFGSNWGFIIASVELDSLSKVSADRSPNCSNYC